MYAVQLAHETMPAWLLEAGERDYRWALGPSAAKYSWRIYARAALDYSGLPVVPRSILRVVLDRHTDDDDAVAMSAGQIANRAGVTASDTVDRTWPLLEAGGWVLVDRPARRAAPTLTLMVPVDLPPDRLARRVGKSVGTRARTDYVSEPEPTTSRNQNRQLVGTRTDYVSEPIRRQGDGETKETRGSSSRDAIGHAAVDNPEPTDPPWFGDLTVWTPANDPRIGRWST